MKVWYFFYRRQKIHLGIHADYVDKILILNTQNVSEVLILITRLFFLEDLNAVIYFGDKNKSPSSMAKL